MRCCARRRSSATSAPTKIKTEKSFNVQTRKPKGRPISGWLILDKPVDFGSTEAVGKIKWLFNAQKAGHAGTLDPLASGMCRLHLATRRRPSLTSWTDARSTNSP